MQRLSHRFFNTAGPCRPSRHYLLTPGRRLPQLRRLIEEEQYFVIHAARQMGKTTMMRALAEELRAEGGGGAACLARGEPYDPRALQG